MVQQKVKTKFTQQEAIEAILNATKDGGLALEDRVILMGGIIREQQDQIRQEQQVNAALLGWFKKFRALTCNAAFYLAMPGSEAAPFTAFESTKDGCPGLHFHELLTPEARKALGELAYLDTSKYAPASAPAGHVGFIIEGTGTGEPPVPPRYSSRPGAMHRGPSGLPATGARRS